MLRLRGILGNTPSRLVSTSRAGGGILHHNRQPRYSSSSAGGKVNFDQTKVSNEPAKDLKPEHVAQAQQAGDDKSEEHPAKQPDPQPSPSKSTGVRRDGPGSKAGDGEDEGVSKDEDVMPSTGT